MFAKISTVLSVASGLAAVANAHTLFTTAFINKVDQGDGVCVRQPKVGSTSTNPIKYNSDAMVCGFDGFEPVPSTCLAPSSSVLSFWWREWPDYQHPGAIDKSHMGPCSVYMKKVDAANKDSGKGSGWFKIWEQGYDANTKQWCTDKVIANKGIMSVKLPAGLPKGDYLIRPEILALHASTQGDPQFYTSCMQLRINDGPSGGLNIPDNFSVSMPGQYSSLEAPGLKWDVWNRNGVGYPMPGPKVWSPGSSSPKPRSRIASREQSVPLTPLSPISPDNCLIVNGGWCGGKIPAYTDSQSCRAGAQNCWKQSKECYDNVPPTGYANCEVWQRLCRTIESDCQAGRSGPPNLADSLKRVDAKLPEGASLDPWTNTGDSTPAPAPAPGNGNGNGNGNNDEPGKPKNGSPLQPSKDARCGAQNGQTCEGGVGGPCCSVRGWCGSSADHCENGCQKGFGECW